MIKIKGYFKDKENILAIALILYYFLIMKGGSWLTSFLINKLFSYETLEKYNLAFNIGINVIIYVMLGALIIPMSLKYIKTSYEISSYNTQITAKRISYGLLIMYLVSFLSSLVSAALSDATSANQDSINAMISSRLGFLSLFIIIGFIGPIVEELIFRRALFQVFKNNTLSIVISSLSFGLLHMTNQGGSAKDFIAVLIPYVTAGLVFSSLYVKSNRNILVPIACHITNNTLSLLILAFSSGLIH